MFKVLFLLFIVMPIVEIMVLMNVGAFIGTLPTIGLVILTAWIGAAMVRQQGTATYQSVQTKLAQGEMPSDEIIAALLLLVAGVLLLTPGFITDGFGLLLLWPVSRSAIVAMVKKNMVLKQAGQSQFFYSQNSTQQSSTFEGEFEVKSEQQNTHKIENSNNDRTIDGDFQRKE